MFIIFLNADNAASAYIYEHVVKRVELPSKLVIVYDPNIDIKLVRNTINNISVLTKLMIKEPIYKEFELIRNEEDFNTKSNFKNKRNNELKTTGQLEIHEGSISKLRGDIFVFFVDPKHASHFNLLNSLGKDSPGLERAYIQQQNSCFYYSAISTSHSIQLGVVYIAPFLKRDDLSACIHEKLFQVMGLFNDAKGPESFNFDNLPLKKRTMFDEYWLKALYAPKVKIGSSVGNVIAIFKSILNNE